MNRIRFYAYLRKGEALCLKRLFEDGPENAFAWQYPLLLKQLGDLYTELFTVFDLIAESGQGFG